MEIRLIEPSDAQSFVDFYDKLIRETDYLLPTVEESSMTAEKQENIIRKFGDYKQVFIATKEGKIVGFMGVSRSPMSKVRHIADFALGVLSDYKRQGVASKLLSFAENWLKEKGVKRVEMTVVAENKPAIACYEKNGYKHEGTREKSISMNGKLYDELFMAKLIG